MKQIALASTTIHSRDGHNTSVYPRKCMFPILLKPQISLTSKHEISFPTMKSQLVFFNTQWFGHFVNSECVERSQIEQDFLLSSHGIDISYVNYYFLLRLVKFNINNKLNLTFSVSFDSLRKPDRLQHKWHGDLVN